MITGSTVEIVDLYFAQHLGCRPEDLRRRGLTRVPFEFGESARDRTPPKPIWIVRRGPSCVVSATPWAFELVDPLISKWCPIGSLRGGPLAEIKARIESRADVAFWILGYQFYIDRLLFRPQFDPRCRPVRRSDPAAEMLEHRHFFSYSGVSIERGDVFGLFVDNDLAAYAYAKPRGDLVSTIGVVTVEPYRRRGFGKAVVSAVTREILDRGKIPVYDCEQDNKASAHLARSLGFRFYAEDFGCISRGKTGITN